MTGSRSEPSNSSDKLGQVTADVLEERLEVGLAAGPTNDEELVRPVAAPGHAAGTSASSRRVTSFKTKSPAWWP